jgi:signal transduction histidine kinase
MNRILILISHRTDERLLIEWLKEQYEIVRVEDALAGPEPAGAAARGENRDGSALLDPSFSVLSYPFDLCILDGAFLGRTYESIEERRQAEGEVLLPFLLVVPNRRFAASSIRAWGIVDDIIATPVEKVELHARIENLLRARRYSLVLKQHNLRLEDEKAQLMEAMLKAERMAAIGQAITGVAHCVKNMLNGLQGGLFIAKQEAGRPGGAEAGRGLSMLEQNLGRLQDLVMDMLTYSKDREPEYEQTDLNDVISSVVDLMGVKAHERHVELRFHRCGDLGPVEVDPKAIYRCVLNLVSNALDASDREGSRVDVTIRSEPPHAILEVADQGCGMDAATLKAIGRPFFSTKGSRGTGLGLSVTQKTVREHGGRLEVASVVGEGSTFRIYLPVQRPRVPVEHVNA